MKKQYYLDTNCIIFALKGKYGLDQVFTKHTKDQILIPSIVLAELYHGAQKSLHQKDNDTKVKAFTSFFKIIPFCETCALSYGELKCFLEKAGNIIGPNDLIIAATVIANNGILVTNNTKEFCRIPSLKIEDWCA